MRRDVDLAEVIWRHTGIHLRGGDPSVAEHFLNRPKVSPTLDHVSRG